MAPSQLLYFRSLSELKSKYLTMRGVGAVADAINYTSERSRRRQYRPIAKYEEFKRYGDVIYDGFSLLKEVYPEEVYHEIHTIFTYLGIYNLRLTEYLLAALKEISDIFKFHGEVASKNWYYLVDLRLLSDYKGPASDADLDEIAKNWVTVRRGHSIQGSEDMFMQKFKNAISRVVNEWKQSCIQPKNKINEDYEDYVRDIANWALGGASSRQGVVMSSKGKKDHIVKTKWSTALSLQEQQIRELVAGKYAINNYSSVAEKRELGKIRGVVTSNTELYIKCSYISQWLEDWLHPKTCSLFWKGTDQYDHRFNDDVLIGKSFAWPIDQSEFDHQVNNDMIKVAVTGITEIAKYNAKTTGVELDQELLNAIIRDMTTGRVLTPHGGYEHKNGVLSGWRWTALLDSMINLAEFYMFHNEVVLKGECPDTTYQNLVAQGDDISVWFSDWHMPVLMYNEYVKAGFKVNSSKSFVDSYRQEFLRLVASKGSVRGYPARTLPSILWRNPKGEVVDVGQNRINSRATKWLKSLRRGCSRSACLAGLRRDIVLGDKLSYADVDKLLRTPKTLGGLGILRPWVNMGLKIKTINETHQFAIDQIPYLTSIRSKLNEIVEVDDTDLMKWVDARLKYRKPHHNVIVEPSYATEHVLYKNNYQELIKFMQNADPSIPLKCRFEKTVLGELRAITDVIVNSMVRKRQYSKLRKYVIEEDLPVFERMYKTCSRRVFDDWLTVGLKISNGVSLLLDDSVIDMYVGNYRGRCANCLLHRHSDENEVISSSLRSEQYSVGDADTKAIRENFIMYM